MLLMPPSCLLSQTRDTAFPEDMLPFLQCLWECGGMLAAPAISGGALHKALAFIAPKLVGGRAAQCRDLDWAIKQ